MKRVSPQFIKRQKILIYECGISNKL